MNRDRENGLRRFSTGVPPLDDVLGGGVPAYAVVLLAGEPGTGKTILAQQMLFANAARGGKGLYMTTLSESPIKAARYQSSFTFFDPEQFGEAVVYMDIGETIRRHGLTKAVEVIGTALRDNQPSIVVIDSFKAIHDLATSPHEVRVFAYDLAIELSAAQATSFLLGEYAESDIARMPEFAVADGIIWLSLERVDAGARRYLRVLKMRGVDNPATPFGFEIGREGISLFALPPAILTPDLAGAGRELVRMGVPGLDDLLRGGIPVGSPLLLSGEAGVGKTTLAMQYLYQGAFQFGQRGIYFSYEETPAQVMASAKSFGWDFQPLVDRGLVRFHYTPLPLVNADAEVLRVQNLVLEFGAQRAAIDSLTMLMHGLSDPDVIRRHVFNLAAVLKRANCTALITTDPPAGSGLISRFGVEESIIDGVIVLKAVKEGRDRKRYVEVYKLRGVNHASGESLFRITPQGLRVFPRTEEATR